MKLFNFFKPALEDLSQSYIKQLFMIAISDGTLDEKEYEFILNRARVKFKMTENDIQEIKENLKNIKLVNPKNKEEKFQLLYDLVWVMMIDDEIHQIEIDLCSRFAMRIGYDPEMVVDLVQTIKSNQDKGVSSQDTYDRLLMRMG